MVAILFSKSRSRTMVSFIFIHNDDVTHRSLRAQLTVHIRGMIACIAAVGNYENTKPAGAPVSL